MTISAVVLAVAGLFVQSAQIHIQAADGAYKEGQRARSEGRFSIAADCFERAIQIEPTFLEAREALIDAYEKSGDELAEGSAITKLLQIQPQATKYRLRLGTILLTAKEPEKALAQFSLVLKRDSLNADGLLGFAAAARQLGMNDRAQAALERGRRKYPSDERFKNLADLSSPGSSK